MVLPAVPISLALVGLDAAALGLASSGGDRSDQGSEVRALLGWVRGKGLRGVQLNAATPGVRARDLDRSGRRDLAATLRRLDLRCSGLDLWVPPEHFTDPLRVDRAAAAVLEAIDLTRDLATLANSSVVTSSSGHPGVLSLMLPEKIAPDVLAALDERARARSVVIADHAWPVRAAEQSPPGVAVGIDPATLLAAGEDPGNAVSRLGGRVACARLTDIARGGVLGAARVAVGSRSGRLDVLAYLVALATGGYAGHAVLDVRGVQRQEEAVDAGLGAAGAIGMEG